MGVGVVRRVGQVWRSITTWLLCGVGNSERNGEWRRLRISAALQESDEQRTGAGRLEDSSGDGGSGGGARARARTRGSRVESKGLDRRRMQDAERCRETQRLMQMQMQRQRGERGEERSGGE